MPKFESEQVPRRGLFAFWHIPPMSILNATIRTLEEASRKSPQILVAYSGGKDSLAVMELCAKTFETVIAFHMYFVPGLKVVEEPLQYARERWGVEVMYYPHWAFFKSFKSGLYCDPGRYFDDIPDYNLAQIHAQAAVDTGIQLIAHGGKKADGLWRKWALLHHQNKPYEVIYPVVEWTKYDVFAYLKAQGIPIPDSAGKRANGIGLDTPTLLWLHDEHPEDFATLETYFPYIRAVVYRREWYGIGKDE
jgi:hypothetical protein